VEGSDVTLWIFPNTLFFLALEEQRQENTAKWIMLRGSNIVLAVASVGNLSIFHWSWIFRCFNQHHYEMNLLLFLISPKTVTKPEAEATQRQNYISTLYTHWADPSSKAF
jgi:hypothetical protein